MVWKDVPYRRSARKRFRQKTKAGEEGIIFDSQTFSLLLFRQSYKKLIYKVYKPHPEYQVHLFARDYPLVYR